MKVILTASLLIYFACMSQVLIGQNITKITSADNEWSEGSIMLNDNSELKGLIQYNSKIGILSYKNGETSKSFTPRMVIAFEFFDASVKKQRLFYSFDYYDENDSHNEVEFFEVIKDYNEFVLLSKLNPIEFIANAQNNFPFSYTQGTSNSLVKTDILKQIETIYLFDFLKKKMFSITKITNEEIETIFGTNNRSKDRVIGKKELKEFFGDDYDAVNDYADNQNLRFDKKNDLEKIFTYYAANFRN